MRLINCVLSVAIFVFYIQISSSEREALEIREHDQIVINFFYDEFFFKLYNTKNDIKLFLKLGFLLCFTSDFSKNL